MDVERRLDGGEKEQESSARLSSPPCSHQLLLVRPAPNLPQEMAEDRSIPVQTYASEGTAQ